MSSCSRWLAIAFAFLLLSACGTTPPPDREQSDNQPVVTSLEPPAGPVGTRVTVRGADLGADGSVTFGGMAANVVAWSAEELEVEVPAGAPAGWQELVVAPAAGGQASAGFFVGVAFDGEPEDVGTFLGDLEPGTHALLPPGELSLPGLELVVDGVHLHGHPDGTLLQLGAGGVVVIVDKGGAAGLSDMEVDGTYLAFRPAGLLVVPGAEPEEPDPTAVLLEGLRFTGSSLGHDPITNGFGAYDLTMRDVHAVVTGKVDLTASSVASVSGGRLRAPDVRLSSRGDLDVVGAYLEAQRSLFVNAWKRATVTGSTLRAHDGDVTVNAYVPVGPGYGTIPDAGRLRVEGSVIEAHEVRATGTPDAESGVIRMAASGASLELIENVRVSAADAVHITVHGYPGGEATLRLVDNQDIAAGRFEPEGWVPDGVGVFVMTSGSGANVIEVTGNLIRSDGVVELHTRKAPADVTITSNRIESTGDDDGTIDVLLGERGEVIVADNLFDASSRLAVRDEPGTAHGKTVRFEDNVVNVAGGYDPRFDLLVHAAACLVERNEVNVGADYDSRRTASSVYCESSLDAGPLLLRFVDNEVTLEGPRDELSVYGFGEGAVTMTGNDVVAPGGLRALSDRADRLIADNRVHAAQLFLSGSSSTTRLSGNTVTFDGEVTRMLYVFSVRHLEASGNTFTHTGTPNDEAVAIGVQASAGDMTLDVTDNRFVNLARAIELRAYDSTVVGDVTSNVFDFPIVARPQAASFSLVDSDVTLDLTLNRWGEVTSAGALEDLMQFSFEGVSRLELVLGPVGTQP